ncbi:hypothetical protein M758_12G075800 [Ceratodon purpureus]|nr:hypothetical protein M758_12G075800 [Ceratodon purpureus]
MGSSNGGQGGRQSGAYSGHLSHVDPVNINILLDANSRLKTGLLAATDEVEKLKVILRKLEAEKEEWSRHFTNILEPYIGDLQKQLHSKTQEIQKLLAPYGSYCVSGPNPYLLKNAVQRVSRDLHNFVLSFRIAAGKHSTDIVNLSKDEALVSSIFFSRFERVDLGVEDAAKFIPPALLPELSFQEYKAFDAFIENQEDCRNKAAVEPYWGKFSVFCQMVATDMNNLIPLGHMEVNDGLKLCFWNLAMSVWVLHKLTLSFDKGNVRIMRVARGEEFNKEFMQTVPGRQDEEEHKLLGTSPLVVQHLILPGLWINGSIFKCYVFLGSQAHQEINCTSQPGNEAGCAMNGPDQPPNMADTDHVETVASSEERPGTDHHHVSMDIIRVETLTSEEHPVTDTPPLHPFVLWGIIHNSFRRLRISMSRILWKAILSHFQSRSRGQICEVMESQTSDLCQPLLKDQSSSGELQELEPQPECNQPVSDSINSSESELHVAVEVLQPPHSEQAVNNDITAPSDDVEVCKNSDDVHVDVQDKVEASSSREHPDVVPGIGWSESRE